MGEVGVAFYLMLSIITPLIIAFNAVSVNPLKALLLVSSATTPSDLPRPPGMTELVQTSHILKLLRESRIGTYAQLVCACFLMPLALFTFCLSGNGSSKDTIEGWALLLILTICGLSIYMINNVRNLKKCLALLISVCSKPGPEEPPSDLEDALRLCKSLKRYLWSSQGAALTPLAFFAFIFVVFLIALCYATLLDPFMDRVLRHVRQRKADRAKLIGLGDVECECWKRKRAP